LEKENFVVYHGLFRNNTNLFNSANLIFSTTAFNERQSTYLNIEGKTRATKQLITPFKFLFSDLELIKALVIFKEKFIPANFSVLKKFYFLGFFKKLVRYNFVLDTNNTMSERLYAISRLVLSFKLNENYFSIKIFDNLFYNSLLNRTVVNYYSSDIFSRNSKIMSLCALKIVITNFSN